MAKNEIVNVLTIKTEESQKTIKGLKKEISDLKKILDNAVIGTEEFDKASKDLVAAQNTLKAALNGNKQTTEALAGSYDALVAEMAELKKEWRATADEAKRNDLGKEIDKINDQLKELDSSIGNHQRNVGNYAGDIKEALGETNNSVAASAESFKKALAEQDDATITTRTKLESVQKVATGLAAGYAAVQGAMTLLNIENENLQKAMVKVQSAMAIAQGVGGLKDLVEGVSRAKVAFSGAVNGCKAFIVGLSGVKKAIIGTGIGALVVAVGLLIANWDKISKMMENINPQKKAAKAARELNLEITKLANQSAGDKIAKVKELSIAYSKMGDNLNAKKQFVIDYKDELANMGIEMKNVNDADEIFVKNTDAYITAIMARAKADAARKKATEEYQKALDGIVDAEKGVEEAKRGVEIAEKNARNTNSAYYDAPSYAPEASQAAGMAVSAARTQVSNAKDNLEKATDELTRLKTEADESMKNLFSLAAEYDAEADKLLAPRKPSGGKGGSSGGSGKTDAEIAAEKQKEIDEELRLSKLNEEQKLIDALDKKYIEYMKVYEGNQEKQLEILTWYTDEYTKIVEKGLDEEIAAQQKAAAEKEKLTKEEYEKKVAASEQRLDKRFTNIDKQTEKDVYTTERRKPSGNGEINDINNEISKLETLKNITNEQMNLKVAAINAEQELFKDSFERWKELEEQKKGIKEQTKNTLLELEEQLKEQTEAKQRALAGSIASTFTAALSSASSIIGALQEGIDTTTKEGFEKNKKMQIANATIQMLVGITSALAGAFTTKSGPWDIALAAIQAATIATTGGIQIANIKKQTFEGAGSGSTPSVSPSMGISDSLPISYTRNLMTDTETEEMNQAQRVYILESDIQDSNRKVEIRETNTNF